MQLKMTTILPQMMAQHPKTGGPHDRLRVRRVLFDEPVDHNETRRNLHRELEKIQRADTKRWNFNFEKESPLDGRYHWVRVPEAATQPPVAAATSTAPSTATSVPESDSCAAADSSATQAGEASGVSRQTSVTDFFQRKRKRTEAVKTSTDHQTCNETVAKLPKAS